MTYLYFVEVMGHAGDPARIPFECEYSTAEELRVALRAGPVTGNQIIYGQVPRDFRLLRSKIETTIDQRREPIVEACRFKFVTEMP